MMCTILFKVPPLLIYNHQNSGHSSFKIRWMEMTCKLQSLYFETKVTPWELNQDSVNFSKGNKTFSRGKFRLLKKIFFFKPKAYFFLANAFFCILCYQFFSRRPYTGLLVNNLCQNQNSLRLQKLLELLRVILHSRGHNTKNNQKS